MSVRAQASVLFLSVVLTPCAAAAQSFAVVGADVHPVARAPIPGATVVVEDGRITAVGLDVPVPAGLQVIDGKGRRLTPGLVETDSSIGLVEIGLEPASNDSRTRLRSPIRAAVRARPVLDRRSSLVGVTRAHGVTSVVSAPSGGLISGHAAWLDLADPDRGPGRDAVTRDVAVWGVFGEEAAAEYGRSRAAAFALFREVLEDARSFRRQRSAFLRNGLYRLSAGRRDLEALDEVVARKMPLVLAVSRAEDILAVLELKKRERIQMVLRGAEEGWLVAGEIAQAGVPVILDPFQNLPTRLERRNARADNATLLVRAGVEVALATRTSHNARNLRFALGNAVRAGVPAAVALRAATLTPAEIFGVERDYGSIEKGRRANLVLWSGDPFEPRTRVEAVWIHGRRQPLVHRQRRLEQRAVQSLRSSRAGPS